MLVSHWGVLRELGFISHWGALRGSGAALMPSSNTGVVVARESAPKAVVVEAKPWASLEVHMARGSCNPPGPPHDQCILRVRATDTVDSERSLWAQRPHPSGARGAT